MKINRYTKYSHLQNPIKVMTFRLLLGLILIGCKGFSEKQDDEILAWEGNYVSDGYDKRNEGYDWVGVSIVRTADNNITISIRSRADKKRPTCTFNAEAKKVDNNHYVATLEGKAILFSRQDNKLVISAQQPDDVGLLRFYCSGGGTLARDYVKIDEALDEIQIDKTIFSKTLTLQNIGFNISSIKKGSGQELTIIPFGLSIDNRTETLEVDGVVTNAEIEDLNSDGFPEILVYIKRNDGKGNVIGYSVNNGKSVSQIYFPPVDDDPKLREGYAGHDEFSIVETTLAQRFPLYKDGHPTGKARQIDYKLVDGEASRKFVVKAVTEYDSK